MEYGYSNEVLKENTFLSRVFSLNPVKEIVAIHWGEGIKAEVFDRVNSGSAQVDFDAPTLEDVCKFLQKIGKLPANASLHYFDELTPGFI